MDDFVKKLISETVDSFILKEITGYPTKEELQLALKHFYSEYGHSAYNSPYTCKVGIPADAPEDWEADRDDIEWFCIEKYRSEVPYEKRKAMEAKLKIENDKQQVGVRPPIKIKKTSLVPPIKPKVEDPFSPDKLSDLDSLVSEVNDQTTPSVLPIGGEEKYNKQEPGGTMGAVNIEEIQKQIASIDEASFRVYNEDLCPLLWDEYKHLNPRVRVNLLRMAYDFYDKTDFQAPIKDIYLMGSAANYNWTPDSDADVHVIIDFKQLHMPIDTATKSAKVAGAAWNNEHQVWAKGHKVEINIQDANEVKPHVTGIYSLINDSWVRMPSHQNLEVDKPLIQRKYSAMKDYIVSTIQSGNYETMKQAKKYVDAFRQYGLDTGGELSVENIVFKILRSRGFIKGLKDAITTTYDKEMTVTENVEPKEDYLGTTRDGMVTGVPVSNGMSAIHNDHGMVSGYNGQNWRYIKSRNKVYWNTKPADEDKVKVDDFLSKKGIQGHMHKIVHTFEEIKMHEDMPWKDDNVELESKSSDKDTLIKKLIPQLNDDLLIVTVNKFPEIPMASYVQVDMVYDGINYFSSNPESMERLGYGMPSSREFLELPTGKYKLSDAKKKLRLNEVTQSDINSTFPPNSALHKNSQGKPVRGNFDYKKLTLSNLKSLRSKEAAAIKYLAKYENKAWIDIAMAQYRMLDTEIKRRLAYINAPIGENNLTEVKYSSELWMGWVDPKTHYVWAGNGNEITMHDEMDSIHPGISHQMDWSEAPKWRYRKDLNTVYWWTKIPDDDIKQSFEDWLLKTTKMTSPKHLRMRSLSSSPEDIKMVSQAHGTMEEGVGAGIPEQDRLHIPGHRWQIKSKDAPKTPKMKEGDEKFVNSLVEQLLMETPELDVLKKNRKTLTDDERTTVVSGGAVWDDNKPGVWKSEVNGKVWYVCNTHRAYQCKPTIKGAIKAFEFIKTTS